MTVDNNNISPSLLPAYAGVTYRKFSWTNCKTSDYKYVCPLKNPRQQPFQAVRSPHSICTLGATGARFTRMQALAHDGAHNGSLSSLLFNAHV